MTSSAYPQRFSRSARAVIIGAVLCFWVSGQIQAQDPDCPTDLLTPVPEKQPRPAKGPGSVADFADLSKNDAAFEVVVGQGRILTTKADLAVAGKRTLIAIGDPSVIDSLVLNPRQIRIVGLKIGVTDLSITNANNETYTFEVRVVADLPILRAQLQKLFPSARVKLSQIRDHVVLEGQARDAGQVARIVETVKAYLHSVQIGQARKVSSQATTGGVGPKPAPPPAKEGEEKDQPLAAGPEPQGRSVEATIAPPQVINLLRVPGARQVMLKVRIAELNRTALRQIGADLIYKGDTALIGTNIAGNSGGASATAAGAGVAGIGTLLAGGPATIFGVFENAHFAVFLNALRKNDLLKILAEPNLVALDGHQATFLAGGEFPVPVPQTASVGGAASITIEFKKFGVSLAFLPNILEDDTVRLSVDPEVSSIDFSIGTSINGTVVPGLNTRKSHTVVEMKEGQTLAIAGLLSVTLEGTTSRIPGLGDLPILGPFFSNTTSKRTEKELIVLVTPCLVEPMKACDVPPTPGDEVNEPTDLEFYLGNRIEGRTGRDFRSTVNYDCQNPLLRCLLRLESRNVRGPHGFCD